MLNTATCLHSLWQILYALSAICLRVNEAGRGKAVYERAVAAEQRHRYLFGQPRNPEDSGRVGSMYALDELATVAHRAYATESQRAARLQADTSLQRPLSAAELMRSIDTLWTMPEENKACFASDPVGSFAVGDVVVIHGLRSEAARMHNGALGVVEGALVDGAHGVVHEARR